LKLRNQLGQVVTRLKPGENDMQILSLSFSRAENRVSNRIILLTLLFCLMPLTTVAAVDAPVKVQVNWQKITQVSRTTPTLQVVVNPLLRRGSAIHGPAFSALRDLKADYVRFVPWYPYPRLAIAEMEPPRDGHTSWDFSLIDPLVIDFLEATKGHPVVLNFSTVPQWMFKTSYTFTFPKDHDEAAWTYVDGTELRDPTMKELGDYYARIIGWYTNGGFIDEYGKRHVSNYHYKIDYWEVFNEPEFEHQMTPEQYTARYDAIVKAIRKVAPKTKFVGISLAYPAKQPRFFEYFLNKKNHQPGIPLDMISYHFYAQPPPDLTPEMQPPIFFEQADKFLDTVRFIETTRQRLSPNTRTAINEVGSILPDDIHLEIPGITYRTDAYWNLSGAMFAYLYAQLAQMGIDVIGESQLVGYPSQFPSVTMINWETGQPNARYWVLKLLIENFGPGDKLMETDSKNRFIHAQAFVTRNGQRKLLLINKRDRGFEVDVPGAKGGELEVVDQKTVKQPAVTKNLVSDKVNIEGLAVVVVTLPAKN
jgi:hypothetical protein